MSVEPKVMEHVREALKKRYAGRVNLIYLDMYWLELIRR